MDESGNSKKIIILGGLGLIIVLALVLGFWLWRKNSGSKPAENVTNIDAIRSAFAPSASPPSPVPAAAPPSASPPSAAIFPRGPQGSAPAAIPSIGTAVESYKNSELGFETEIDPASWQPVEHLNVNQVMFTNGQGQIYNIESLLNINETLDSIALQLKGSPSVSNLQNTTFLGEPALKFNVAGGFKQGIAILHAGRLFYIMGPDISNGPLLKFTFL